MIFANIMGFLDIIPNQNSRRERKRQFIDDAHIATYMNYDIKIEGEKVSVRGNIKSMR